MKIADSDITESPWSPFRTAEIEFVPLKYTTEFLNSGVNIIVFILIRKNAVRLFMLAWYPLGVG
jgi:hypothetical protein